MTGIKIGIRIPPCRPAPEVADAAAIEFASQWIDDATAVWFARNVFMFGSAAELAPRVQALALAGVDEVIVTDGSSFELPHELIERVGAELLPLPPETNSVYS